MGKITDQLACCTEKDFTRFRELVLGYNHPYKENDNDDLDSRYNFLNQLLQGMYEDVWAELAILPCWEDEDEGGNFFEEFVYVALTELCRTVLGKSAHYNAKGIATYVMPDDFDTWGDYSLEDLANCVRALTMALEWHKNRVVYFKQYEYPMNNTVIYDSDDTLIAFAPDIVGVTEFPHKQGVLQIKKPVFLLAAMQLAYFDNGFTFNETGFIDIWGWLYSDDLNTPLLEFINMIADEEDDQPPLLRMWLPDIRELRKTGATDEYVGRALAEEIKNNPAPKGRH